MKKESVCDATIAEVYLQAFAHILSHARYLDHSRYHGCSHSYVTGITPTLAQWKLLRGAATGPMLALGEESSWNC